MNFLAHLYLSGESEEVKVGNFIGDYVKGRQYLAYPEPVQKGILLHRSIDWFTDRHPAVRQSQEPFREAYGRYAGIVTDLVFDHFLAARWPDYSPVRLRDFTRHTHAVLLSNFRELPLQVQQFLPFMIQSRRLETYATAEGLGNALALMSNHTSLPPKSRLALLALEANRELLFHFFQEFMTEITAFVEHDHQIKINRPEPVVV